MWFELGFRNVSGRRRTRSDRWDALERVLVKGSDGAQGSKWRERSVTDPPGPSWRLSRGLAPSPAQQTLPRPGVAACLMFGGEQDPACPHFQHGRALTNAD